MIRRVVWVSRHELTFENHLIMQRAFGVVSVVQFRDTVNDVQELIKFAEDNDADAFIVVLPPHLIQQLLQRTDKPVYRFVVEREVDEQGNAIFKPVGLERIVKIEFVTERIV